MIPKLAIIDLGTNTFHLLIAEWKETSYVFVYRERLVVKLGKGGINQDIIKPAAIERAIEALKSFKIKIDEFNISTIYAFGTSALRNATNAQTVVDKVREVTGIEINIISGDKEAEFIYLGVRSAVDLQNDTSLIIDIGGGSVEFIIGNDFKIFWKRSIEIGAQRLLEKFHQHDPILPTEIEELNQYFDQVLNDLMSALVKYQPKAMVGSSGTYDTLSDIYCMDKSISKKEYDPETPLTIEFFYSIYAELISKNRKQRMLIPGMIEMRVDMIVVASCLIRYLLEHHPFENIRVSSYALKEGVLASLIK